MNDYLSRILGSKVKVASAPEAPQTIDLSKISAADFIAGVENGTIVLPEPEKTAGQEQVDLSKIPTEQLLALQAQLEKTASPSSGALVDIDLNALTPDQLLELGYAILADRAEAEQEKLASDGTLDLNELTEDEFLDFCEGLEEELGVTSDEIEKNAAAVGRVLDQAGKRGFGDRLRSVGRAIAGAYKGERFREGREIAARGSRMAESMKKIINRPGVKNFDHMERAGVQLRNAQGMQRRGRIAQLRGAAETATAYGAPAGAVAAGGYKLAKKDKK